MGLSAYEISFPLLVFNRSRLSHGRERKLSKATNLTAPASHTKGCRTNHPLPTPSPNTQFSLGLGLGWFGWVFFAFDCNKATQKVLFSSGLETANKKREFTAIISVSCLVFSQSLLKQKNNFLGTKSEESFASK